MAGYRRHCMCRAVVEADHDRASIAHAERVHEHTPEHQRFLRRHVSEPELFAAHGVTWRPASEMRLLS